MNTDQKKNTKPIASWGEGYLFEETERHRYVWRGRYVDVDGTHKRKSFVAVKKKDLMDKVEEWQHHLKNRCYQPETNITVQAWCDRWLGLIKPTVKQSTYDFYDYICRLYICKAFGVVNLKDLTTVQIQTYINSLVTTLSSKDGKNKKYLSPRTANIVRVTFKTILFSAVDNGILSINPVAKTKPLREIQKPKAVLDSKQLLKLLKVAEEGKYINEGNAQERKPDRATTFLIHCYYAAIHLAATTGMRKGEVFGLQWSDLDFSKKILHVSHNLVDTDKIDTPKTQSSIRNILLSQKTVEVLKHWQKEQEEFAKEFGSSEFKNVLDFVFTNSTGHSVSVDNFLHRHWTKLCKAAEIPGGFTFHGLRRTHATLLLQQGCNVKAVSERLGHSDVAMTMRVYAQVLKSMQEEAVKVIDDFQL